jgi:hypothetical protein
MKKVSITVLLTVFSVLFCKAQGIRDAVEQQKQQEPPKQLIPDGYSLFEDMYGDLNGDGRNDYVLIVKARDRSMIVHDEELGELDRNRRGIMIFFANGDDYQLVLDNRQCFPSENEDGGVYYAPELGVNIEKGNLYLHYDHGRYGWWKYTFRYRNGNFVLIGYDNSEDNGPAVIQTTSINFLTRKRQVKVNVNEDTESEPVFEETWDNIKAGELIKLSEIADFDELTVNQ